MTTREKIEALSSGPYMNSAGGLAAVVLLDAFFAIADALDEQRIILEELRQPLPTPWDAFSVRQLRDIFAALHPGVVRDEVFEVLKRRSKA